MANWGHYALNGHWVEPGSIPSSFHTVLFEEGERVQDIIDETDGLGQKRPKAQNGA